MKKFKADLIHFGYQNKNGRIYTKKNIDLNYLNNKTIFGEIDHPNSFDVSLSKVSHSIDNFRVEGCVLYGDIKILSTQNGHILEPLVDNKMIVFRPRGSGQINHFGIISNYKVYAFDAIDILQDSFEKVKFRSFKLNKIIDIINKKLDI